MTLNEAFKKAIKAYFDNDDLELSIYKDKEGGGKYTRKYLTEFENGIKATKEEKTK